MAQSHIHPFLFIHSFIQFLFVSLSVAFDVMRPPVTDRKVDVAHLTDPFPLKLIQEMGILLSRAAGICLNILPPLCFSVRGATVQQTSVKNNNNIVMWENVTPGNEKRDINVIYNIRYNSLWGDFC